MPFPFLYISVGKKQPQQTCTISNEIISIQKAIPKEVLKYSSTLVIYKAEIM